MSRTTRWGRWVVLAAVKDVFSALDPLKASFIRSPIRASRVKSGQIEGSAV